MAEFPPSIGPDGDERSTDIVGLKPLSANGHDPLTQERMKGPDEDR